MFFIPLYLITIICFFIGTAGGAIFGIMWMFVISLVAEMESSRRFKAWEKAVKP